MNHTEKFWSEIGRLLGQRLKNATFVAFSEERGNLTITEYRGRHSITHTFSRTFLAGNICDITGIFNRSLDLAWERYKQGDQSE